MRMKTNDGTPDAVKIACPVWNGGKGGDNFKTLPIIIGRRLVFAGNFLLCMVRRKTFKAKL
ncbi:MAG: hypothetical protein PHY47_28110 [Lachnospiraceae bacterium]|nr:hypothetical protein [Lachnospiraceae bacterium]